MEKAADSIEDEMAPASDTRAEKGYQNVYHAGDIGMTSESASYHAGHVCALSNLI